MLKVGPELAIEALSILREAAAWANERGIDVWSAAELDTNDFQAAARSGLVVVGFSDTRPAATMLLQLADPVYWPEVPANSSLFLHKIAVRREFAGRGWLTQLITFAANYAGDRNIPWLRLDTLSHSPLQGLYERHGFVVVDEAPFVIGGRLMIRMERRI